MAAYSWSTVSRATTALPFLLAAAPRPGHLDSDGGAGQVDREAGDLRHHEQSPLTPPRTLARAKADWLLVPLDDRYAGAVDSATRDGPVPSIAKTIVVPAAAGVSEVVVKLP